MDGAITLHGGHFHAHFPKLTSPERPLTTPNKPAFQFGLLPLRSPLLGESWLVSFPPLNYMLKFSGLSYLMWDPKVCIVCVTWILPVFSRSHFKQSRKKNKILFSTSKSFPRYYRFSSRFFFVWKSPVTKMKEITFCEEFSGFKRR